MTDSTNQVADGKAVQIHYVLRNGEGAELDRSGEEPLTFLQGHGNIVPGLEKALVGKSEGEKLNVAVPPEQGYGPKHKVKPLELPRSAFPEGAELKKGMSFMMHGKDGRPVPVWIKKIQGKTITVDPNHPLAGVTLHFEVEVISVRDATEEELSHGHVHGPGGHHH